MSRDRFATRFLLAAMAVAGLALAVVAVGVLRVGGDAFATLMMAAGDSADHAREMFDQLEGDSTLDLAELKYISSAGISELLLLYKRLNADGCEVRIQNANGHVKNIFEIAGLSSLFPMD